MTCVILLDNCNVYLLSRVISDFFSDECSENAAEECSEFLPEVPLSEQFNTKAFEQYCK